MGRASEHRQPSHVAVDKNVFAYFMASLGGSGDITGGTCVKSDDLRRTDSTHLQCIDHTVVDRDSTTIPDVSITVPQVK